RGDVEQARLAVEEVHHLATILQPLRVESLWQTQFRQAKVRGVRILADEERVVLLAEEAGVLTGGDRAVGDDVRIADKGRRAAGRGGEAVDDAAVGGEQITAVAQALIVDGRGEASEAVIAGRVVVAHLVADAADEGDLVHDARHARQLLGNDDARSAGANGPV